MSGPRDELPAPSELASVFHVAAVRRDGETVTYLGEPLRRPGAAVDELRPLFARQGYELTLERQPAGEQAGPMQYALVAEPTDTETSIPWLNVALLLATIVSTLYVGASGWYYIPVTEEPLRRRRGSRRLSPAGGRR